MAIENIQVLRDGAAAQYGSDAIAGVINIDLKKRPDARARFGYGQYSAGDGKNYLATAYCGLRVGSGVIGLTAEYLDRAAPTAPRKATHASSATPSRRT